MNDLHNQWSSFVSEGASLGNNADIKRAGAYVLEGGVFDKCPSRIASDQEVAEVVAELRTSREELAKEYARKAMKQATVAERVIAILKQASISLGRSGFGNAEVEKRMQEQLLKTIADRRPLMLPILMGGGKAANPLKTGPAFLPDLAEWIAWSNLESIPLAIERVYEPGAHIVDVPDMQLHTADLGVPIEETVCHARAAERDLRMLGLRHVIIPNVLDMLRLLSVDWVEGVRRLATEARNRYQANLAFRMDVSRQVESLIYSINTRSLGMSYEDLALLYAALAGHMHGLPDWSRVHAADVRRRVEAMAVQYVAVNWAIRQLGLVERVLTDLAGAPAHLRLSVHAKVGEPRPRLFSASKYFPSLAGGLLPMHSKGVRLKGVDKTRFGAGFEVSARLRNWPAVIDHTGRFLWFEARAEEPQATKTVAMPPASAIESAL